MKDTLTSDQIPLLLGRVGEVLHDRGVEVRIVIVGGAALNLWGVIQRSTVDIDVIALGLPPERGGSSGAATVGCGSAWRDGRT